MKGFLALLLILSSCNYFKSLPEEIDGEKVPPEPDSKENDKTLLGVDSNNNFIRDDVERWIIRNYDDPNMRRGLKQYARYKTKAMLAAANGEKETSIQYSHMYLDTRSCLREIGYDDILRKVSDNVKDEIFNTKDRILAEADVQGNFGGQKRDHKSKEYYLSKCEFEIIRLK